MGGGGLIPHLVVLLIIVSYRWQCVYSRWMSFEMDSLANKASVRYSHCSSVLGRSTNCFESQVWVACWEAKGGTVLILCSCPVLSLLSVPRGCPLQPAFSRLSCQLASGWIQPMGNTTRRLEKKKGRRRQEISSFSPLLPLSSSRFLSVSSLAGAVSPP